MTTILERTRTRNVGDPFEALMCALVIRAIDDVRSSVEPNVIWEAQDWLRQTGLAYLELLEIELDERRWRQWIATGCPDTYPKNGRRRSRRLLSGDELWQALRP